jgi:hypothetical protein
MQSKPANLVTEDAACDECGSFGALEIGGQSSARIA